MSLPNPLPDNPLKWLGWKNYNSPNLYARLCLDFSANATPDMVEEHCRQLLVWWQKKLPLKSQPSNPMSQLLRGGLDEAPHFLAEARTKLLDPAERAKIDAEIHVELIGNALEEFKKLLGFTLADRRLTKESEGKLRTAGAGLGLTPADIDGVIAEELERTGSARVVEAPPPEPAPPVPVAPLVAAAAGTPATPLDEFRRILKMSRLCLDGEEMSDDQRDAMCNLGESLGLTGGQAEDVIDEYLEEMASAPMAPAAKAAPTVLNRQPQVAAGAVAGRHAAVSKTTAPAAIRPPVAAAKKEPEIEINLSPAARAQERLKFPNFVNAIKSEMFLIPSGRFVMGSQEPGAHPNESPLTPVVLSCFYMARLPITNAQYEMFAPSHAAKRAPWADDRHPVLYVSWDEAQAFCRWLTNRERKIYRLPTEAEWEFSARGGDGRTFPWGGWSSVGHFANFADARTNFPWRDTAIDDGFAETAPVGSFPRGASPFGIEDLAGNVFEWCLDTYEPYKGKEVLNPRVSQNGRHRVYRGGSWKSRMSSLRATARAFNEPAYLGNDIGFRMVCECA